MKKLIIFALMALISASAFAQYATVVPAEGPISYKSGNLYDASGQKITKQNGLKSHFFDSPALQRRFEKGRNQYRWGIGSFIAAGVGIAGACIFPNVGRGSGGMKNEAVISGAVAAVGLIVGNCTFWSGRANLKELRDDYNHDLQKEKKAQVTFGLQPHGLGLAMTF